MRVKLIGVSNAPRKCESAAREARLRNDGLQPVADFNLPLTAALYWPKSVTKYLLGGYCKPARTVI
jgi:hypothetical protein